MSSTYPITFEVSTFGADEAASQFSTLSTSMQTVSTNAEQTSTSVSDMATAQTSATAAANENASASGQNAVQVAQYGTMAASAVTGIASLAMGYDNLHYQALTVADADLKLQNSHDALDKAQLTVKEDQDKLTAAVAKYGEGSAQATAAQDTLTKAELSLTSAHDNLTVATNRDEMAHHSLQTAQEQLVLQGVSTAAMMMSTLIPAIVGSESAMAALGTISDVALGPIGIAIMVIVAVSAILYEAWTNNWGNIRGITASVWNDLQGIFKGIENALGFVWNNVLVPFGEAWGTIWNGMGVVFKDVVDAIGTGIKDFVNGIIDAFNAFISGINLIIDGINAVSSLLGLGSISTFATIPTLAAGGITTGPGLFIAGERGPELLAGASVTPLPTSAGSSGGGRDPSYDILNRHLPQQTNSQDEMVQLLGQILLTTQLQASTPKSSYNSLARSLGS